MSIDGGEQPRGLALTDVTSQRHVLRDGCALHVVQAGSDPQIRPTLA
jgi:hypothetical protein